MAAGEGQQVMALISKRLRALRKKNKRITEMEESISQGKPLNKEQEEILRSKPIVTALIEELEKLRLPPPSASVSEEISLASQQKARKEEDLTAKKDLEDCTISDGLNADEVSKDNTSSVRSKKPRRKRQSKRPDAGEVSKDNASSN